MNAPAVLAEIEAVQGRVWVEGGKLRVEAPVGAIDAGLRARIAADRARLVGWLDRASGDIAPVPRTASQAFPLSLSQHAFFMLDQLDPGNAGLNVVSLRRIRGRLDVAAFEQSVAAVTRRHETLRTRFAMQGGRPVQLVDPDPAPCCHVHDLGALAAAAQASVIDDLTARRTGAAFSLQEGRLFRVDLYRLGAEAFVISLRLHHIVSDAASIEIFYAELVAYYRACQQGGAASLPDLPIQYADYAAWQDRLLGAGAFDRHVAFWRAALADVPALLPMLRPGPNAGASVMTLAHTPEPGTRAALTAVARGAGITLFVVLLSLFQWLLARWTRHDDIPVIVPVSGRARPELGPMIGLFVTGIVLRTRIDSGETLAGLCRRVSATLSDALDHQDVSVESLEGLTRQSRKPIPGLATLSKIAFNHIAVSGVGQGASALAFETLASDRTKSVFDAMLVSIDGPEGLSFKLELREGLFEPAFGRQLLDDFAALVARACQSGQAALLAGLALRPDGEMLRALAAPGGSYWPLAAWQRRLSGPPGSGLQPGLAVARPIVAPDGVAGRLERLLAAWPCLGARLEMAPAPLDEAYLVARPGDAPVVRREAGETPGRLLHAPLDCGCLFDVAVIEAAKVRIAWVQTAGVEMAGAGMAGEAADGPFLVMRVARLLASATGAEAIADFLAGRTSALPALAGFAGPCIADATGFAAVQAAALPPGPACGSAWPLPGGLLAGLEIAAARHGRTAQDLVVGLCAVAIAAETACEGTLVFAVSGLNQAGDERIAAASVDLAAAVAGDPSSRVATLVDAAAWDRGARLWFGAAFAGGDPASAAWLVPPDCGLAFQLLRPAASDASGSGVLRVVSRCAISADRLLRRVSHLAGQVAGADPAFGALDLLCPGEQARIVPAGRQSAGLLDPILAFRACAEIQPDAPCLQGAGGVLSYGAVAAHAGVIAAALLERVGPGGQRRVGVMMERGEAAVLALLGILAAGLVYVPLDPALPDGHLETLGERARLDCVLVDAAAGERGGRLFGGICLALPDGQADPGRMPAPQPCAADAPAYIIFTSGSTGTPKGVAVGRAALAGFLAGFRDAVPLAPGDRFLSVSSIAFDISLLEMLLPLASGARLVVASAETVRDAQALAGRLAADGITHMQATPSLWRLLLEAGWDGHLRVAFSGGEALSPHLAARLLPRCDALYNLYGPTEATIWSCAARIVGSDGQAETPIGWPLANTHAYVVDGWGRPVPPGAPGALLIGGATLASGYLDDPARTRAAFAAGPGGEPAYRSGDRVRLTAAGLVWLGRADRQVKLRGHRIELGGIEAALRAQPGITHAMAVLARPGTQEAAIVAFVAGDTLPDVHALRGAVRAMLPPGSMPQRIVAVASLPTLVSGKIDASALLAMAENPEPPLSLAGKRVSLPVERQIAAMWRELLGHESFTPADSFFDVGGQSILVVRLRDLIRARLGADLQVVDLFDRPRIADMAQLVLAVQAGRAGNRAAARPPRTGASGAARTGRDIAIIGMAGQFPGAPDLAAYWRNLAAGTISITALQDSALLEAGLDPALLRQPGYVRAAATLDGVDAFDAAYFRLSPRDAALMDPQHRLLLQCSLAALEDGGYAAQVTGERIGLFAGVGFPSYFFTNIQFDRAAMTEVSPFALLYANEKDYAVSQIAYRLDLRGPCMTVATACSTGLVAVHQACRSLLQEECEVALAGAAKVMTPQTRGYLYSPGGILSPDGACRPFDGAAGGTVFGSGVAAVLLKPLDRALADGDAIHAVIRGSAVNNDGAGKIGLTAPSRPAQAEVLEEALRQASVAPESVCYIEAHGTGTALGDPIELGAICDAYGAVAGAAQSSASPCAIGAVKANIGHLDPVAGLAGLVKAVLSLKHGQIPPNPRFERPNPGFSLAGTRFFIGDRLIAYPAGAGPRRAGVSAFGIGGTNAHVILEEAPACGGPFPAREPVAGAFLLPVSAHSAAAFDRQREALAECLETLGEADLPLVAATLQLGRAAQRLRRCVVAGTIAEAVAGLRAPAAPAAAAERPLVLLFAGQSGRLPGGYGPLLEAEPAFAGWVARCAEQIAASGGPDVEALLRAEAADDGPADTGLEQPCLFALELALANTLQGFGLRPAALLGHSLGELAAATFAGVLSLEEAARLVVRRGALMQGCQPGAMAAIHAPAAALAGRLGGCEIAARNGPALTIVSGAPEAVAAALEAARQAGWRHGRMAAARAFHSRAMAPAREVLRDIIAGMTLRPPELALMSGFNGGWLTDEQATDPDYWAGQLCRTVAFDDGLRALLAAPQFDRAAPVVLEIGPGEQLAPLARREAAAALVLSTGRVARPGRAPRPHADWAKTTARLWEAGLGLDWKRVREGRVAGRVHLPGTSFEPTRHWIAPAGPARLLAGLPAPARVGAGWVHEAVWEYRRPLAAADSTRAAQSAWLLLGEASPLLDALSDRLRRLGACPMLLGLPDPQAADQPAGLAGLLREAASGLPQAPGALCVIGVADAQSGADARVLEGFDRLVGLARAIGATFRQRPVRLAWAAHRLFSTAIDEAPDPLAALALGPMRGLGREIGNMRTASVCLGGTADAAEAGRLAQGLIAECAAGLPEAEIALRGGRRFACAVRETPLPDPVADPAADAAADPGAVLGGGRAFLLTGGLGDLGFVLAQRLASRHGAGLVIVGRRPAEDEAVRRRLACLREAGGRVCYVAGDCADPAILDAAVQAAQGSFGRLDGAFHLAGIADGRLLDFRTRAHTRAVAEAKVLGGLHLSRLAGRHGWSTLVFFSSITARLASTGQLAYAAANAALDSLAQANSAQGIACRSIGWDAWRDIGMAQRASSASDLLDARPGGGSRPGVAPEDGLDLLERLLVHDAPCPIVCTEAWQDRLAAEAALALRPRAGPSAPDPGAARQAAAAGPDGSPEAALTALWARSFGVSGVGLDDDFFDLGGNSLMAVNLLPDVERILGTALTADIFMRAPTIRLLIAAGSASAEGGGHLVTLRRGTQAAEATPPTLVLVHPIGGEVLVYRDVVAGLAPGRAVLGFRNGGRDAALRRAGSVEEMAAAYAGALVAGGGGSAVFLAGASFGGAVALEMGRLLRLGGRDAPRLAGIAMIDTPLLGDPVAGLRSDDDILAYLGSAFADDAARDRAFASFGGALPGGAAQAAGAAGDVPEIAAILAVFRYNQQLMSAYRPSAADFAGLHAPVHFIKAEERRPAYDPPAPESGWRAILPGLTLHLTSGNHVTMHAMPHAGQLARLLDRIMAGASQTASVPASHSTHAATPG